MEERYAVPQSKRTFRSQLEIFQVARPIASVTCGHTLRILDANRFRVLWTIDDVDNHQHAGVPPGRLSRLLCRCSDYARPEQQDSIHTLLAGYQPLAG